MHFEGTREKDQKKLIMKASILENLNVSFPK